MVRVVAVNLLDAVVSDAVVPVASNDAPDFFEAVAILQILHLRLRHRVVELSADFFHQSCAIRVG